ncbi:MAG: hypothetical protein O2906_05555 [Bacteroidetes bacterium]|nr:hypothetical protein [Bacteroidota bacterium]MDA0860422.1 hypothetical protein [Bacteroidota bacterium]MDA1318634.1 hypothetical protein [Bacteroidota bacterium]
MKLIRFFFIVLLTSYSCSEESKLKNQFGCNGIEDCLSKYNFEGARAYVNLIKSKTEYMSFTEQAQYDFGWREIINQESDYWFNEGNYEKALSIVKEEKMKFVHDGSDIFDEQSYNLALYKVINQVIDNLLSQEKFKEAKKWCFRLPEAKTDGWTQKSSPYKYDEAPKMRSVTMKKIKDFEKALNE